MIEAKIEHRWHPDRKDGEESSVKFSKSFEDLSKIAKLDFLKDSIFELQTLYLKELCQ